MWKIIIACHVMGQSVIKIPATAMSSEKRTIAVGWSERGYCRKRNGQEIKHKRQMVNSQRVAGGK